MEICTYVLLAIAVVLILALLWYANASGVFFKIKVETTASPYPDFQVAYKFMKGPYKNVGKGYEDVYNLAPEYQSFAIFYDDPNQVPASETRAIVGSILGEGKSTPDDAKIKLLTENGYKMTNFPKADNVVRTWFPVKTRMAIMVAVFRVWSKLAAYTKKNALKAYPWMEICTNVELHYIGFLDHHEGYIVPEVENK